MTEAFIGLGSNLNDPKQQIKIATQALAKIPQTGLINTSSLYRNEPYGPIQAQPDFVNAVALIKTELSPLDLLTELQSIEKQQQRERIVHWGPRTLDLDLLLYGTITINEPTLTLPHPEIEKRLFVLLPLQEIAPQLVLPSGNSISQIMELLQTEK